MVSPSFTNSSPHDPHRDARASARARARGCVGRTSFAEQIAMDLAERKGVSLPKRREDARSGPALPLPRSEPESSARCTLCRDKSMNHKGWP